MPSAPDPEHDAADFNSDGPLPPKLVKFRNLTGIGTPRTLADSEFIRPAKNIGIYARVIAEERKTGWQYWFINGLIEACFMSQIAIGASLTALGAANASHIAITVLGSANTVIAGLQTYLKGQGLPNRLRQYEFSLRKLREHIEDLERHFTHEECKLNVDHEIAEVAAMYHAVRQTAEDNTPDTYLPMAGAGAKLLAKANPKQDNQPPGPSGPSGPTAPALPVSGTETGPEALAASGKPPTADQVAEAGGPEASKPAPDASKPATSGKAPTADETAEAGGPEASKPAPDTSKPTADNDTKKDTEPTPPKSPVPEAHTDDRDVTENTPLLKH